ncbi:MAG: LCP family protein [Lachnospiraceae bacterium]|nr:LCP family protein [Lachnospiraceae bacterium]
MTKTNKDAYEDERRTKKKPAGKKPVKKELSKKEKARKKRRRIVFFTLEILVLIVMVIVLWGVLKVGETGHVEIVETDIVINDQVKEAAETTMLGYRNIALFGVDNTGGLLSKGTRSDTIMVASINQDTGECKLISVYRDTYLNLSNDDYNKCNAAYSKGGPQMAINMLNMNLDLNITDFVTVGFAGLTDTIDALGGVYIDVESNEIVHLNNYQSCIAKDLKRSYTMVESTGYQLLDGLQATGYCRIRYTARGDFERTERQREVLKAVADQAKKAPVTSLGAIANNVFDEVYTSLSLDEIVNLLKDVSKYSITDTAGFPRDEHIGDKSFGTKGRCVVPTDLEADVRWLHEFLFNDSNYEPSNTVKECSRKIQADYAK